MSPRPGGDGGPRHGGAGARTAWGVPPALRRPPAHGEDAERGRRTRSLGVGARWPSGAPSPALPATSTGAEVCPQAFDKRQDVVLSESVQSTHGSGGFQKQLRRKAENRNAHLGLRIAPRSPSLWVMGVLFLWSFKETLHNPHEAMTLLPTLTPELQCLSKDTPRQHLRLRGGVFHHESVLPLHVSCLPQSTP